MKKLYFSLSLFLCWNITTAQYLSKDFNDLSLTSGGWTTQIIIDTTNWFVDSFGGDDFAKCTIYVDITLYHMSTVFLEHCVCM